MTQPMKIAVLASGRGSNLQAIMEAIEQERLNALIVAVISDHRRALALERARQAEIPAIFLDPGDYPSRDEYEQALADRCQESGAQLVVLAGFMRLLGSRFLQRFPQRVVNIHPALLPSFPGLHAQQQALKYGVRYSGCSVHLVDEGVDTGPIILQAIVPVLEDDTVDTLSARILIQEHRIYPQALKLLAEGRVQIEGRRVRILDRERSIDHDQT